MTTYKIARWSSLYENNRTRELKKLDWVPVPNSHDGHGYAYLLNQRNGAALYGAWMAILQVASRCDPRGTLVRDGARPHSAASIALMTRFPESLIADALAICSGPEMGWIICENTNENDNPAPSCGNPASGCDNPASSCASRARTHTPAQGREGKGREGNGIEDGGVAEGPQPAAKQTDEEWLSSLSNDPGYQGIDVRREHAKMVQWCAVNRKQPTRRRFLGWLNRIDKPMENAPTEAAKAPTTRPPSLMDIRNVIEAKKAVATTIRNRHASDTANGTVWSDQTKRREYFNLKKEIDGLTAKMASSL